MHVLALLTLSVASVLATAKPLPPEYGDLIRTFESARWTRENSLDADSSHSYDQQELILDYRVDPGEGTPLTGTATLILEGVETMDRIPLHAQGMTIHRVNEWDLALSFTHVEDTLWVDRPLSPGESVRLDIDLTVPPVPSFSEVGYHVDWNHVFTTAEPYGSRLWYPCWDQPYDKFDRLTISVNMPDHWSLASNGMLTETSYPEPGRKRQTYRYDDPISSYLVMIAAGDYLSWEDTAGDVPIRYMAFPEDSANAALDWQRTPQMIHLYDSLFSDYPFEAYGMVEASVHNGWGAMEHQTFTSYGHRLVNGQRTFEYIVAHELVHQWFGDCLSPVDFRHMWLNEGFATYFAAVWLHHIDGDAAFLQEMQRLRNSYMEEDGIFRYSVYDPPPGYLFGAVVYNKAAWVLHMLREQLLGDSLFYAAIQQYVSSFPFGLVETEDLIQIVNEVSGEDYGWFFDQWVYEAGHPELVVAVELNQPTEGSVGVSITQIQTSAPIFRFPLTIDYVTADAPTDTNQHVLWFEQQAETEVFEAGSEVAFAALAEHQPLLWTDYTQSIEPSGAPIPTGVTLGPAYPNPFNPVTTIPFEIAQRSHVRVDVFDLTGRHVRELVSRVLEPGSHTTRLESTGDLASGIYIVRLECGATTAAQKLILLK